MTRVTGSRDSFSRHAEYVFRTFFNTLGIKANNLVGYGNVRQTKSGIRIEQGGTAYFEKRVPYDLKNVRYFTWKGRKLPILFYEDFKEEADLFDEVKKNRILPVDIIASSFFFLSTWQELVSNVRDKFGRFPWKESIQRKLGITITPIVNEYMSVFLDLVRITTPDIKPLPFWPDNKGFGVCLTHDIDDIRKWGRKTYRQELKNIVKTRSVSPTLDYWIFEKVSRLERKKGIRSSFFFLPEHTKEYDIGALHFSRLFAKLRADHFEIGLHSASGERGDLLMNEKEELEKACGATISGVRHHFLKFKNPRVFGEHEKAGLKYDSSLGFAEHEGYRTGFAFPYYPYDPGEECAFKILEMPLNIMDTSLIHHQQLTPKEMWQRIERLLVTNLNCQGCLVILWHESSFDSLAYTKLYTRILDWTKNHDGIGLSCEQLLGWWTTDRGREGGTR
jgi:hypothetical protein